MRVVRCVAPSTPFRREISDLMPREICNAGKQVLPRSEDGSSRVDGSRTSVKNSAANDVIAAHWTSSLRNVSPRFSSGRRTRLGPAPHGCSRNPVSNMGGNAERPDRGVAKLKLGDRPKQDRLPHNCDALPRHKEIPAKWSKDPHHSNPEACGADAQDQNAVHANT